MQKKMPPSFGRYYKMRIDAGWGQPRIMPVDVEFDYDTYGGGVEDFRAYSKDKQNGGKKEE